MRLPSLNFAQLYVEDKFPASPNPLWNGERYAHERIRIGYFSSDLRHHALSYLMAGVFEQHDRSRFEVTAFSLGAAMANDDMRVRLKNGFEHFIDAENKPDAEIAALARSMEIDIAVDLNGFTTGARTNVFAMCMSPVQVNYLGYPATMGAPYMDYIIADPFMVPPQHQAFYSEKIAYLPECFQAQ